MQFALDWRNRTRVGPMYTPRLFLDYIVDGESLYDRHGHDKISCLGWFVPDEDERAAQRLALNGPPDVEDRVSIYVCAECGDVYCGALTAIIEQEGDEIVWREIAHSTFNWWADRWSQEPLWIHEPLPSFSELRFHASDYLRTILSRPPTTH